MSLFFLCSGDISCLAFILPGFGSNFLLQSFLHWIFISQFPFFFKIHFLWASRYPKWISLDKERIRIRMWWLGTFNYCLHFLALSLLLLSMSCFVELENLLILLLHANLPWSFPPAFYNNITHQPQSHFNQLVTEMCYYIVCIGNGGKYCIMLSNDILQLLVNPFIQE